MNNRPPHAAQRLEGALDQMLARLRQHLHGHIRRNPPRFDQLPAKIKIRLRGGGKADLDLLEAQPDQQIEHPVLALRVHRINQRLIPIAQVHAAPERSLVDALAGPMAVLSTKRWESERTLAAGFFIVTLFSLSRGSFGRWPIHSSRRITMRHGKLCPFIAVFRDQQNSIHESRLLKQSLEISFSMKHCDNLQWLGLWAIDHNEVRKTSDRPEANRQRGNLDSFGADHRVSGETVTRGQDG